MTTPVSLTLPQFDRSPELTIELCRRAPGMGISGVFAFDHLAPIGDPHRPVLEGAAVLGAAAASVVDPIRLGSLVLRVTLRPPEVTAAIAATVAAMVGDRAVIGLGVGDRFSLDEAQRFGMARQPLATRMERLEKTIESIRRRSPSVAVWVGGLHPLVRKVAARLADGWNAWGVTPEILKQLIGDIRSSGGESLTVSWGGGVLLAENQAALQEAIAHRGGETAVTGEGLIAGTPRKVADELAERAALVDEVVVSVLPNRPDNWELFAASVIPTLS